MNKPAQSSILIKAVFDRTWPSNGKFIYLTYDPAEGVRVHGKVLTLLCLSTCTGQSWLTVRSCLDIIALGRHNKPI